jgi:hypothetical protein
MALRDIVMVSIAALSVAGLLGFVIISGHEEQRWLIAATHVSAQNRVVVTARADRVFKFRQWASSVGASTHVECRANVFYITVE